MLSFGTNVWSLNSLDQDRGVSELLHVFAVSFMRRRFWKNRHILCSVFGHHFADEAQLGVLLCDDLFLHTDRRSTAPPPHHCTPISYT